METQKRLTPGQTAGFTAEFSHTQMQNYHKSSFLRSPPITEKASFEKEHSELFAVKVEGIRDSYKPYSLHLNMKTLDSQQDLTYAK